MCYHFPLKYILQRNTYEITDKLTKENLGLPEPKEDHDSNILITTPAVSRGKILLSPWLPGAGALLAKLTLMIITMKMVQKNERIIWKVFILWRDFSCSSATRNKRIKLKMYILSERVYMSLLRLKKCTFIRYFLLLYCVTTEVIINWNVINS